MNIDSYSVSKPISGICKRHAVWGQEGNVTAPLIYLQRPAWIKDDEIWMAIVESVSVNLPQGFQVK